MLKTLEEPPGHVKFILATTDPQKIPVTVLSRCLQFNLKQIPQPQIKAHLQKILELERVAGEDEALTLLARAAHGSMRDSLSLLDQAIAHGGGHVELQAVRAMLGSVEQEYLHDILSALQRRDGAAMIAVADRMAERSLSFEIALQELATFLHRISLAQTVPKAIAEDDPERAAIEACAAGFGAEEIQLLYQIALHGRQDIGLAPDDYAGFTMTLMRMLAFMPEGNAAQPGRSGSIASKAPEHAPMLQDSKKKPSDIDWNALVSELPLAGMERMLAHNCQLIAWRDGRIELRVPHAQRHLVERAYQDRLKLALEQHLGTRVRLEISVGAGNGNTLAEIQGRENQQRQNEAMAAIDSDPFVRDLIEDLDARVRSSTIKPVP
jgi:DNA polymerase-3 subunit gamma/tau